MLGLENRQRRPCITSRSERRAEQQSIHELGGLGADNWKKIVGNLPHDANARAYAEAVIDGRINDINFTARQYLNASDWTKVLLYGFNERSIPSPKVTDIFAREKRKDQLVTADARLFAALEQTRAYTIEDYAIAASEREFKRDGGTHRLSWNGQEWKDYVTPKSPSTGKFLIDRSYFTSLDHGDLKNLKFLFMVPDQVKISATTSLEELFAYLKAEAERDPKTVRDHIDSEWSADSKDRDPWRPVILPVDKIGIVRAKTLAKQARDAYVHHFDGFIPNAEHTRTAGGIDYISLGPSISEDFMKEDAERVPSMQQVAFYAFRRNLPYQQMPSLDRPLMRQPIP